MTLITHLFTGNVDLSAALEYYGSERARQDFINNKEEPAELIAKNNIHADNSITQFTRNQRNASVVDHLFEGQFKKESASKKHKIGQVSRIISEAPEISNFES